MTRLQTVYGLHKLDLVFCFFLIWGEGTMGRWPRRNGNECEELHCMNLQRINYYVEGKQNVRAGRWERTQALENTGLFLQPPKTSQGPESLSSESPFAQRKKEAESSPLRGYSCYAGTCLSLGFSTRKPTVPGKLPKEPGKRRGFVTQT